MLSRLFGSIAVLLSAFIIIPFILSLPIVNRVGQIEMIFIIISCVLIFIGAIVYIFRERKFS